MADSGSPLVGSTGTGLMDHRSSSVERKLDRVQEAVSRRVEGNPAWHELPSLARQKDVTLVCAAKDQLHNEALVLKELLERST
jgi:uncharacterized protein YeaO (DUF488 family)